MSEQLATSMIGASVRRREDARLLTGKCQYLDDIDIPCAREAAFLRSAHASARIRSIDVRAASRLPGVLGVFTAADLAPMQKAIPPKVVHPDLQDFPRLPLADGAVHYVGEPIAVVVATSRYVAEDALDLIEVDYDIRPAVSSTQAALCPDAPLVHEGARDNVSVHVVQRSGDPDAALAEAPNRLKERFSIMRGGGHSMETRGVAARFDDTTQQ